MGRYDWDVWPGDTSLPRVACGNTGTIQAAIEAVEKVLAADDSAFIGTVGQPYGPQLQCRRSRVNGSYVWGELHVPEPKSAAN
jgi:hypothetical protein